jgi:hypothetical protein
MEGVLPGDGRKIGRGVTSRLENGWKGSCWVTGGRL